MSRGLGSALGQNGDALAFKRAAPLLPLITVAFFDPRLVRKSKGGSVLRQDPKPQSAPDKDQVVLVNMP